MVAKTQTLLKSRGWVDADTRDMKPADRGDQIHLSIHPSGNRMYLKRYAGGDTQQHLFDEATLQPFNENNFRLHLIIAPAPPSQMPEHDGSSVKKEEELVVFDWNSEVCPQISLYELNAGYDSAQVKALLPPAIDYKLIDSDGLHPALLLHLKATDSQPGVWIPNTSVFARDIHKEPITKARLQEIIQQNGLDIDISALPDDAVITDYKMTNSGSTNSE